jgi:hypothetical protein
VFNDYQLGTSMVHIRNPKPVCNTMAEITTRSPIYRIHGSIAVDPSLKPA